MLVALLSAYLAFMFFGADGGQFGELMTRHVKDQVNVTVMEDDRRKAALEDLSAVNDSIGELNEKLSAETKALEGLIRDYDSKPADFDRLFSEALAKRREELAAIWANRQKMLEHIQADEWETIVRSARAEMEKAGGK